jgi:hypothetical protein
VGCQECDCGDIPTERKVQLREHDQNWSKVGNLQQKMKMTMTRKSKFGSTKYWSNMTENSNIV